MNPFKSIIARFDSVRNTFNSRYWEYTKYYEDGEVWENTFLFESFGGANFQGNPYYIYKELLKRPDCQKYRIYISSKDPEGIRRSLTERDLCTDHVTVIEIHSDEYKRVLSHAKFLVNNVSFTMDFIKKDEQVYLNTWHGTPLKTLGRTVHGDPFAVGSPQRNFLLSDYLIAPNALTKKVYLYDHMVHDIMPEMLVLGGYPRNSIFFDSEARQSVKDKYDLHGYKTIFYMPTWRGTACGVEKVDQVSDIEKLAKELGDRYKVFVKFHPAVGKTSGDFQYCYNMPANTEVYEFLNAMDILITDYSSVFFDFASTGKRIVLYQYDREEYYQSRGVYQEVEDKLNFPIAYNFDQLLAYVTAEDYPDYSDFTNEFCPFDSINSAKEALELLLNHQKHQHECELVDLYVFDAPISDKDILALKEKLSGTNFRFVFVLNRKSQSYSGVKSWSELDYLSINTYNRLRYSERVSRVFLSLFLTRKAKKKLEYYGSRERKRLWGNMRIGSVYTRSGFGSLPVALRYVAEQKIF